MPSWSGFSSNVRDPVRAPHTRRHDASGAPLLRLRIEQLAPRRDGQAPSEADDASLTQSYADALGATIAEYPAQYFWWHRRWKAA